jgi:hypothetical protein
MTPIDCEKLLDLWKNIEVIPACAVEMDTRRHFLRWQANAEMSLGEANVRKLHNP